MTRSFLSRARRVLPGLGGVLLVATAGLVLQAQPADRHNPLRAAYMRAHFDQAMQVHDAVVRGDLADAKRQAAALAQRSPDVPMPVGAEAFHGALTRSARQAAEASTLAEVADATATVLGTCGQCHKAMHVRATVPPASEVNVGGVVGHMLMHQRGTDALVEGLVAPSESQWVEGVRAFAAPKLEASEVPGRMRKTFDHGETDLAVLAGHMAQAHRTRDREELYGKVIGTCGSCHQKLARHGGPSRR